MKGKYSVEVVGHDKKKVLWLRGFDLNIFDEDKEGVVREECSGTYIKMLIKLWPGDWIYQLKRMNRKFDEENGK